MIPVLALEPVHILGIVIVAVIILGIVAYFIVNRFKDKKFIENIEKQKEEREQHAAEREEAVIEYRKNKNAEESFLNEEAKKEAISQAKKFNIGKRLAVPARIEDCEKLSDEEAEGAIILVKDEKVYDNKIREIVVTTTQLNAFEENATINPLTLIEKGIIPKYGHYYLKIQAKAPLKKALNVEAHEYDEHAAKMILLAGGSVIKVIQERGKNMGEYVKTYDGLQWIVKLILAIIPITGWLNAILYRLAKGHLIAGVLCIFFGWIFWVIDLITVILSGKPVLFAD